MGEHHSARTKTMWGETKQMTPVKREHKSCLSFCHFVFKKKIAENMDYQTYLHKQIPLWWAKSTVKMVRKCCFVCSTSFVSLCGMTMQTTPSCWYEKISPKHRMYVLCPVWPDTFIVGVVCPRPKGQLILCCKIFLLNCLLLKLTFKFLTYSCWVCPNLNFHSVDIQKDPKH